MEEVIKKIINIENRAREILDNAEKENEKKFEDLDIKISELKEKIVHDVNKKIKQLRDIELQEAIIDSEKLIEQTKEKLMGMEQHAKENNVLWRDELVRAVLER